LAGDDILVLTLCDLVPADIAGGGGEIRLDEVER
jgi:hypothetical protein